jgi:hypothetical protein
MVEPREEQTPIEFRLKPWMAIASIALAHIIYGALVRPFDRFDRDWIAYLAIGAWHSQPILFGLWLALGSGCFSLRFQSTVLTFALVLFAGVMSAPYARGNEPEDVPVRVAIFLATAAVMLFARRWTGWKIAREPRGEIHSSGPVRFNIKSLLVWTAFLAVLLAVGRITWPFISPLRLGSLSEVVLGTCIFGLVFGPLAFVSLSLLSTRLISGLTLATFVGVLISELSALLLLAIIEPSAPDQFETILLIAAGGALACCVTVLPLRLVGYRLTTPAWTNLYLSK